MVGQGQVELGPNSETRRASPVVATKLSRARTTMGTRCRELQGQHSRRVVDDTDAGSSTTAYPPERAVSLSTARSGSRRRSPAPPTRRSAATAPTLRAPTDNLGPAGVVRTPRPGRVLSLGTRACSVRPGAAVGLPGRPHLGHAGGRWIRRWPARGARTSNWSGDWSRPGTCPQRARSRGPHGVRGTVCGWRGRKLVYASGGAELGRRHGSVIAQPYTPGHGRGRSRDPRWPLEVGTRSARLAVRGLGWSPRQESALLLRHWWPLTLVAGLFSRTVRRNGARGARRRHRRRPPRDRRPAHDRPRPPPRRPRLRCRDSGSAP